MVVACHRGETRHPSREGRQGDFAFLDLPIQICPPPAVEYRFMNAYPRLPTARPGSRLSPIVLVGLIFGSCLPVVPLRANAQDPHEFFESRIRPVLIEHCYECHSSASPTAEGGLSLDDRDGLLKGGQSGPAIMPGDPAASPLMAAIRYESVEMPPAAKLSDEIVADFETWIRMGAVDPRDAPPSADQAAEAAWKARLAERKSWWSLQQPIESLPPEVDDPLWSIEPVDRFIFDSLSKSGLAPAPAADADTIIRRLAFVLTGLPPESADVVEFRDAWAADPDAAIVKRVDRLLDSPHFGERFARHWMDVVRYTDTWGYEWDNPAKGSWEYRDYLIRAFNADIGFDQLVREQIAGDLLPQPRIDPASGLNESLIGPMFYHMGEHRHGASLDFNGIHQEMTDNKVDAFSKAFLAMTVACARCHDHKLDAISQADYYALAGVFMTARWTTRDITADVATDRPLESLRTLRDDIRVAIATAWTSHAAEHLRPASLKQWAIDNRAKIAEAKPHDIAFPFAHWLDDASAQSPEESSANDQTVSRWQQLADQWRAESAANQAANGQSFVVISDFSSPGFPDNWAIEGQGLKHGYTTDGTPHISLDGHTVIASLLPRGYHTHALSSKLAGAIRLPHPESFPGAFITLRFAGGDWAGRIDVPQNAFQAEGISFFDPAVAPSWHNVTKTTLANGVTRVLTEFATAALHPNFPPRTGLARSGDVTLANNDNGMDKRSWMSLTEIASSAGPGGPADTFDRFTALYDSSSPDSNDAVWNRLSDWLSGVVGRWSKNESIDGDVDVMNWLLAEQLLPNDFASLPELTPLVTRYREIEASIPFARTATGMDERGVEPVDYRLNIRGNVDDEGPAIPRNFLEVFHGHHHVGQSQGSGRLELAQYLASDRHPQTARVYVNRVWQAVFGQGIVATPSDFGKLGDSPSHPELLDWIAIRFMNEGWSTKRLVRSLVLSQTFRQSGRVAQIAADRDPANRLLHHYPTRRLEAEAIRDSLLAVSGRLDRRPYGPPIYPPRVAEDPAKRLFTGPWDSDGRRSLYIQLSIMDPPKFLVGFNLPDLKLPTGRRDETEVPAQALIMLNDPLVVGLAEHWATALVAGQQSDPAARLSMMFLTALGREPTADELTLWTESLYEMAGQNDSVMSDHQAWAGIAHTLMNTTEFIHYR